MTKKKHNCGHDKHQLFLCVSLMSFLCLILAVDITEENLEDLLAYDDLFLDYFNAFLSLPVCIANTYHAYHADIILYKQWRPNVIYLFF